MKKIIIDEKQMEAIRTQYYGTDSWMKTPNGKSTRLTEWQWLFVRTSNFKMAYGDWEYIGRKHALESLSPIEVGVLNIVPEFFSANKGRSHDILRKQIEWAYSVIRNKTPNSPIGKVIISHRGIRDSLFKGTNRFKASLYPIMDSLIESSVLIYPNIDENGERQFILGNKYSRDKNEAYVGIVIKVDSEGNKYYSHTIFQKENNRKAQGSSENQKIAQKLHPIVNNILSQILNVNLKTISIPIDLKTYEPFLTAL